MRCGEEADDDIESSQFEAYLLYVPLTEINRKKKPTAVSSRSALCG
jgi:hypothetical protein